MKHSYVDNFTKQISMGRYDNNDIAYEGIDNLLKALHDGSLLRKLRNENSRLKRELKKLRKEFVKLKNK